MTASSTPAASSLFPIPVRSASPVFAKEKVSLEEEIVVEQKMEAMQQNMMQWQRMGQITLHCMMPLSVKSASKYVSDERPNLLL